MRLIEIIHKFLSDEYPSRMCVRAISVDELIFIDQRRPDIYVRFELSVEETQINIHTYIRRQISGKTHDKEHIYNTIDFSDPNSFEQLQAYISEITEYSKLEMGSPEWHAAGSWESLKACRHKLSQSDRMIKMGSPEWHDNV